jgi:tRNA pseudouridine38-40 synthase
MYLKVYLNFGFQIKITFREIMRTQFLARFSYNGGGFYGVQEQPNLKTVLGVLRERIENAANKRALALTVAARTDKGVNALENYATFWLKDEVDPELIKSSVENQKNDGLIFVELSMVSKNVHARGNALGKTYRYLLADNISPREIKESGNTWDICPPLNLDAMKSAAKILLGKNDFSSFRGGGCQAGSPIKTIEKISIERNENNFISIQIDGDGFLRKMIRNIVGLLAEIGSGLRCPLEVESILQKKSRQAAGIMAPPQGLTLVKVLFKI